MALPTSPELTLDSASFRVLLLRRLRLPLQLDAATGRCCRRLDSLGDHRAACPRSGVLRARGGALERAAARVCREAGARVVWNALLRDLNLHSARADERRVEVIAWAPALGRSATCRRHNPRVRVGLGRTPAPPSGSDSGRCAHVPAGVSFPPLLLVALALETGGRWSHKAAQFVRILARCRARSAPPACRTACVGAVVARWSSLLAFAAARSFGPALRKRLPFAAACADAPHGGTLAPTPTAGCRTVCRREKIVLSQPCSVFRGPPARHCQGPLCQALPFALMHIQSSSAA